MADIELFRVVVNPPSCDIKLNTELITSLNVDEDKLMNIINQSDFAKLVTEASDICRKAILESKII